MRPLISSSSTSAAGAGLIGRVGEPHAARLHPPAGEHLRLDDDRPADAPGDPRRLRGVGGGSRSR